jgi:hypothetical protein
LLRALDGWQAAWSDEIEGAIETLLSDRESVRTEIATLEAELGIAAPVKAG